MENGNPGQFSFNRFTLSAVQMETFDFWPFVGEQVNGSHPFANGLNGLARL
jgi:hypothetical protein